jgi:hypothetical protein
MAKQNISYPAHEWTVEDIRELFTKKMNFLTLMYILCCHPEIKIDKLFNVINLAKNF